MTYEESKREYQEWKRNHIWTERQPHVTLLLLKVQFIIILGLLFSLIGQNLV